MMKIWRTRRIEKYDEITNEWIVHYRWMEYLYIPMYKRWLYGHTGHTRVMAHWEDES